MSDHDEDFPQHSSTPVATGPLIFVLCFALFVAGFWVMAISFDSGSGFLFGLGFLTSALAFIIPIHLLRD